MTSRHTLRDRAVVFPLAMLALALAPATGSADVIPMDVTACDMHALGAACMDAAGSGVCIMSRCTRLDYTVDASPGPGSLEYDCVRCVVGDAGGTGASDASAARDAGPMTPPRSGGCSASRGRGLGGAALLGLVAMALCARPRRRA